MHPAHWLSTLALALLLAAPAVAETPDWIAQLQRPPAPGLAEVPAETPTPAEIQTQQARIESQWREFLGRIDVPPGPPAMRLLEEVVLEDGITRRHIELEVEPGIWTTAYLLVPPGKGPFPAVVSLHPTSVGSIRVDVGLVPDRLSRAFGIQLARRGFVTIAPRNYLWRADEEAFSRTMATEFLERRPGTLGMMKMVHDASRAFDFLLTLPEVDPARIGTIGHSLGGKEVTFFMALDPRVACGVSSEGGIELPFSNYQDPWYLGAAIQQPGFNLRLGELLWLIAPRPFLLIGGDSGDDDPRSVDGYQSWPAIAEALPVYRALGAPAALGLLVHDKGHDVPDDVRDLAMRWLEHHLKPNRQAE